VVLVAPDAGRDEVAVVGVRERRPRHVLRRDLPVERRVGRVPLRPGELRGGLELPVQRRHVQVGAVVVVRLVDVVAVQEDVQEVVRVRIVRLPPTEVELERLAAPPGRGRERARGEVPRVHVDPDLREVELDDLRDRQVRAAVAGEHQRVRRAPLHQRLRLVQVRLRVLQRPDLEVAEPGDPGRQDLVGPLAGEVAPLREDRLPVDRQVDGLADVDVAEEPARRVHRDEVRDRHRADLVLAPVDAVLPGEVGVRSRVDALGAVVRLAGPDPEHLRRQGDVRIELERVDVRRTRRELVPLVERVPLQHEPRVRLPGGHVVRARGDERRLRALRLDPDRGRDRLEERHREPGEDVGRRLRQRDPEPVAAVRDDDARGVAGLAVEHGLRPDDVGHERSGRRLLLGVQRAVDRPGERGRGDGLPVGEAEAAAEREGVGAPVRRDAREARGDLGDEPGPGRALGVGEAHEVRAGRAHDLPRVGVVRERRVDEVDVRREHAAKGAALPDGRRPDGLCCEERGQRARHERPEDRSPHLVAPFARSSSRGRARRRTRRGASCICEGKPQALRRPWSVDGAAPCLGRKTRALVVGCTE
jgi:hypothetical protein